MTKVSYTSRANLFSLLIGMARQKYHIRHEPTFFRYSLVYWVIQAGLLTPLTFARHRLSPVAAFTSDAYFLHTANFKAFLEARSHNVSGNKQ